jgi:uncharacterized repeat protein (TIGR01451 family)
LRHLSARFALLLSASLLAATANGQAAVSLDPQQPLGNTVVLGGVDCAGGEIYDDGTAENGYSGNPATVSNFQGVMQFTPVSNPGTYDTVCVGLVSPGGPNLDFQIQVFDDDGPFGGPGTPLGSVAVSAAGIPGGLPCAFYSYDISSMNLNIPGGSVWIGVQWNPMLFPSRFICADESVTTPHHPGLVNFNNPDTWQATQSVFANYRAKIIRAVEGDLDADLQLIKTVAPDAAVPGEQVVFTLTVTNLGPADATGVVVTDTLPAGMTHVGTSCGATVVGQDITWNIGNLADQASVQCDVTVVIDPGTPPGALANDASVSGDQPDPTPGNDFASAVVEVGEPVPEVSVLEIPTLGQMALLILALLVTAGAVLKLRGAF